MPASPLPMPWLRLARWPGVFVLALGLCACATDRNTASEREIAAALQDAKALAARGYQPSGTHGSEQFVEAWTGPEGALIVNVIMPRDVVDAPVVVYLPGLAGPADEGERWRHAWAEAGYAVLSIQKPSAGGGRRAEGAATGAASMPPRCLFPSPVLTRALAMIASASRPRPQINGMRWCCRTRRCRWRCAARRFPSSKWSGRCRCCRWRRWPWCCGCRWRCRRRPC